MAMPGTVTFTGLWNFLATSAPFKHLGGMYGVYSSEAEGRLSFGARVALLLRSLCPAQCARTRRYHPPMDLSVSVGVGGHNKTPGIMVCKESGRP